MVLTDKNTQIMTMWWLLLRMHQNGIWGQTGVSGNFLFVAADNIPITYKTSQIQKWAKNNKGFILGF